MNQAPWIPIVVLTSVDDEATGMEAVRRGAQDYLVKGEVDGWLLVRTIRYAIERKRTQRELQYSLALAGEAQRSLLPSRSPPDWTHFRATARSRMCGIVGGDFYDFIRLNEDQIAVFIGDVMGHDVRAALLMTQILGLLRSEQRKPAYPGDLGPEPHAACLGRQPRHGPDLLVVLRDPGCSQRHGLLRERGASAALPVRPADREAPSPGGQRDPAGRPAV